MVGGCDGGRGGHGGGRVHSGECVRECLCECVKYMCKRRLT